MTQELIMGGGYRWCPEGNPFLPMLELFRSYIPNLTKDIVEKAYEEAMKKYRERAERRPTKLMRRGRQYPMSVDKYNEFVDKAWKKHRKPKMHKKGIIGVKWQSPICKPDLENGKYLVYSIDKNADGKYILKLNNPSEN